MKNDHKRLVIKPLIVTLCVVLATVAIVTGISFIFPGWWANQVHAPTDADGDMSGEVTKYNNDDLGIAFSYPATWGALKESFEQGCFYGGPKDDPTCNNVVAKFSGNEHAEVTSAGRLFVQYPNPREGLLSDTIFIKDQASIDSYCAVINTGGCEVYENPQGITVAKHVVPAHCNDLNGCVEGAIYYYVKLDQENYPGLSLWVSEAWEADGDRIMDSLRFQ